LNPAPSLQYTTHVKRGKKGKKEKQSGVQTSMAVKEEPSIPKELAPCHELTSWDEITSCKELAPDDTLLSVPSLRTDVEHSSMCLSLAVTYSMKTARRVARSPVLWYAKIRFSLPIEEHGPRERR
jgi:hypothetical protein